MFITKKRHEREQAAAVAASQRLCDAILKHIPQGLFFLDAQDKIRPPVSQSLAALFHRRDFVNVSFEKLLLPIVSEKTLTLACHHLALLRVTSGRAEAHANPLADVDVRLPNADGTYDGGRLSFEFSPVDAFAEPGVWMVRVTDRTAAVEHARVVEDLRSELQTQAEIMRSVLQLGAARLASSVRKAESAMAAIDLILKKPAREQSAFRNKLEETLDEVDRIRREAVALKLTSLEAAARRFEDALHELRNRGTLSGGDFLPLAIKLDQLYNQFALLRSFGKLAAAGPDADTTPADAHTDNGTRILEAPKFIAEAQASRQKPGYAASLDRTLAALTEQMAREHGKAVQLQCAGLHNVPPAYQTTVENIAIQLIQSSVRHGIEAPAARGTKPRDGSLHLDFKTLADGGFALWFQDDGCGLDPGRIRRTAVANGLITAEAAAQLGDRQAIKLIFKSGFTGMAGSAGDPQQSAGLQARTAGSAGEPHQSAGLQARVAGSAVEPQRSAGLHVVRRHVLENGGRIGIASLPGVETRFKISLPPIAADASKADRSDESPAQAQVA